MSRSSRRGFLKAAGAGTAVAGAAALVPATAQARTPASTATAPAPRATPKRMVVHVTDVHSGEMTVLADDRAVTIRDAALAAHLARAFHASAAHGSADDADTEI